MTQDGRNVTLKGPARNEPFLLRLDLGDCPPPKTAKVTLRSGGRTVARGDAPVGQLPPVGTLHSLQGIVSLPPVATPGETISMRALDEARTPAGGRWTLGGRVMEEFEDTETEDPGESPTPPGRPLRGPAPDTTPPGEPIPVTYTDRWGDTIVDANLENELHVVPTPAGASSTPRITGCTPRAFVEHEVCVCGWFPDPAHRRALLIDGSPLGEPLAASSLVAVFRLPAGIAPGEHTVSGHPDADFPAADSVKVVVLRIRGHLDQEDLWLSQSTEMTLGVEGTEEPVTFDITNHTTDVISLTGGVSQQATTSGGPDNVLRRRVTGIRKGDFNISYELAGSDCPCYGAETAAEESPPTYVQNQVGPDATVVVPDGVGEMAGANEDSGAGGDDGGSGDDAGDPCPPLLAEIERLIADLKLIRDRNAAAARAASLAFWGDPDSEYYGGYKNELYGYEVSAAQIAGQNQAAEYLFNIFSLTTTAGEALGARTVAEGLKAAGWGLAEHEILGSSLETIGEWLAEEATAEDRSRAWAAYRSFLEHAFEVNATLVAAQKVYDRLRELSGEAEVLGCPAPKLPCLAFYRFGVAGFAEGHILVPGEKPEGVKRQPITTVSGPGGTGPVLFTGWVADCRPYTFWYRMFYYRWDDANARPPWIH